MNLIRLLVIILVIYLLYRLFKTRVEAYLQNDRKKPGEKKLQNMVRCDRCGLHLPEDEAIQQGTKYFCCEQHQDDR